MCWLIDYSWWRAAGGCLGRICQPVSLPTWYWTLSSLSVCLSVWRVSVCFHLSVYLSVCPSACQSICQHVSLNRTSLDLFINFINSDRRNIVISFFFLSLAFLLSAFLQELRLWPPDSSRRQTLKRLWSLLMKGFRSHWMWRRTLVREEEASLVWVDFWFIHWKW